MNKHTEFRNTHTFLAYRGNRSVILKLYFRLLQRCNHRKWLEQIENNLLGTTSICTRKFNIVHNYQYIVYDYSCCPFCPRADLLNILAYN